MTHEQAVELDMASGYVRGQLQRDELREFEEHLLICEECQNEVERLDLLVRALKHIKGNNQS